MRTKIKMPEEVMRFLIEKENLICLRREVNMLCPFGVVYFKEGKLKEHYSPFYSLIYGRKAGEEKEELLQASYGDKSFGYFGSFEIFGKVCQMMKRVKL